MNMFGMDGIQRLITAALQEPETGHSWLDGRYKEDIEIIGHTNPYYKLFWLISKTYRPQHVVELGSWRGTAAAHFKVGNPYAVVETIDIHKDDLVAMSKTLEVVARVGVIYHNMWTWDAADAIDPTPIDVLFVDAWHEYEYVLREWHVYSPLLADTALVIMDDIMDSPGATKDMVMFWNSMTYKKFLDDHVHPGIPMGFMKFVR